MNAATAIRKDDLHCVAMRVEAAAYISDSDGLPCHIKEVVAAALVNFECA